MITEVCQKCHRKIITYKRTITGGMAVSLKNINLLSIQNPDREFFHINEFLKEGGKHLDYSHLTYFGLISNKANFDSTKASSGFWKITQEGKEFLDGSLSVPKFMLVRLGFLIGASEEYVTINDIKNINFNLERI